VLVGFLVGAVVARSRSGDDTATTPASVTTTTPTITAQVPPTSAAAPATTAPAPTTTVPPAPAAGPATPIVPADAPPAVRDAATVAQRGANALAAGDWDAARRSIAALGGASDASLASAWAGLEQSTLVVIDWKERGPATELRLGQVAVEQVDGATRTSLYCVTWTVRDGSVATMAGQQVVAAPWQAGTGDAAAAAPVLDDACQPLDRRGPGGGDDD
jgi:hypothetical protein